MTFIEVLALLRSLLYASDATYAFIRRSYYVSLVAVALTFLPLVNQFGTRQLQLEMAIFNALLLSLFIYKHVKLERELKRVLLLLAGLSTEEATAKESEPKRFAKAAAGVLVIAAFLSMVVYFDLKNAKPSDRFSQPPHSTTPSPTPQTSPVLINLPAQSLVQPQSAPTQSNPRIDPQSDIPTQQIVTPPAPAIIPTQPFINLQPVVNQVQQNLPPSVKL